MATLLNNLTESLIETRHRYRMLKNNGIESMTNIYPAIPWNAELYYQLLATLPEEIFRLEQKIVKIENDLKSASKVNLSLSSRQP
ncbi:hypothetical protein [Peribacillus deserti]|uniref:Uncharacterized protein n=1 Tax=Peribacillus deserti TaxID=673318 RepID=A0A2N5LZR0_9BACI|nr:hypothetical protein [Peribacillus deserti]PLT27594.1 hypothetical protein CUU66_23045 [Peribacillus deserti]